MKNTHFVRPANNSFVLTIRATTAVCTGRVLPCMCPFPVGLWVGETQTTLYRCFLCVDFCLGLFRRELRKRKRPVIAAFYASISAWVYFEGNYALSRIAATYRDVCICVGSSVAMYVYFIKT